MTDQNNTSTQTSPNPKDTRLQKAKDAGMSEARAQQYANSKFESKVKDSFWDDVAVFFGGKSSREKDIERLQAEDDAFFNSLLNADYEEKYNSEQAQADRLRAAGINPNLSGTPVTSTGEASQIDDTTIAAAGDNSSILGSQPSPGGVVQKLVDVGVGVASLVAGGVDISKALYELDVDEMGEIFDIAAKGLSQGAVIPGLGQFVGTVNSNGSTLYQFSDPDNGLYFTETPVDLFNYRYGSKFKTKRGKKVASEAVRGMFGLASDRSRAEMTSETFDHKKKAFETGSQIGDLFDPSLLSERDKGMYYGLANSDAFQDYQSLVRDAYKHELEFQAEESKFTSEYYENLNDMRINGRSVAEIKASGEAFQIEKNARREKFQSDVYREVANYVSILSEKAQQGDHNAATMLYFMMSPGLSGLYGDHGNGIELVTGTTPYGAVKDVVGGAADLVGMFMPNPAKVAKGATKAAKGATKAAKAKP